MFHSNPSVILPNHLSILLESLTIYSEITSWNIYENRYSQTCVTIRFSDNCPPVSPSRYRKISDRQALRNAERAKKFKTDSKTEESFDTVVRSSSFLPPVSLPAFPSVPDKISKIHVSTQIQDFTSSRIYGSNFAGNEIENERSTVGGPHLPLNLSIESDIVEPQIPYLSQSQFTAVSPENPMSILEEFVNPGSATVVQSTPGHLRKIHDELIAMKSKTVIASPVAYPEKYVESEHIPALDVKDTAVQIDPISFHVSQSSQTTITSKNRSVQCGARSKNKSSQVNLLISRTSNRSVQVAPNVMDYSVQATIPTSNNSQQVGGGYLLLVSSSCQVDDGLHLIDCSSLQVVPDPDEVGDKSSHEQTHSCAPQVEYDLANVSTHCKKSISAQNGLMTSKESAQVVKKLSLPLT